MLLKVALATVSAADAAEPAQLSLPRRSTLVTPGRLRRAVGELLSLSALGNGAAPEQLFLSLQGLLGPARVNSEGATGS